MENTRRAIQLGNKSGILRAPEVYEYMEERHLSHSHEGLYKALITYRAECEFNLLSLKFQMNGLRDTAEGTEDMSYI